MILASQGPLCGAGHCVRVSYPMLSYQSATQVRVGQNIDIKLHAKVSHALFTTDPVRGYGHWNKHLVLFSHNVWAKAT